MRVSSEDRFLHLLALHQRCSLSTTFHFQKQSQRRPEIIQMIRIIEDHTNGNQFTMLNTYNICQVIISTLSSVCHIIGKHNFLTTYMTVLYEICNSE